MVHLDRYVVFVNFLITMQTPSPRPESDPQYSPAKRAKKKGSADFEAVVFFHIDFAHLASLVQRFDYLTLSENISFVVPPCLDTNRIARVPTSVEAWQGMFEVSAAPHVHERELAFARICQQLTAQELVIPQGALSFARIWSIMSSGMAEKVFAQRTASLLLGLPIITQTVPARGVRTIAVLPFGGSLVCTVLPL